MMTQSHEIAARLTVLETVVKQLLTYMAVRDDDPARWVQTRKTLALRAIEAQPSAEAGQLSDATRALFNQLEAVTQDYRVTAKPGTARMLLR